MTDSETKKLDKFIESLLNDEDLHHGVYHWYHGLLDEKGIEQTLNRLIYLHKITYGIPEESMYRTKYAYGGGYIYDNVTDEVTLDANDIFRMERYKNVSECYAQLVHEVTHRYQNLVLLKSENTLLRRAIAANFKFYFPPGDDMSPYYRQPCERHAHHIMKRISKVFKYLQTTIYYDD